MTRRPPLQRVISALRVLMVRMRLRSAQNKIKTVLCFLKAYYKTVNIVSAIFQMGLF
jgi:hypothetical protein